MPTIKLFASNIVKRNIKVFIKANILKYVTK